MPIFFQKFFSFLDLLKIIYRETYLHGEFPLVEQIQLGEQLLLLPAFAPQLSAPSSKIGLQTMTTFVQLFKVVSKFPAAKYGAFLDAFKSFKSGEDIQKLVQYTNALVNCSKSGEHVGSLVYGADGADEMLQKLEDLRQLQPLAELPELRLSSELSEVVYELVNLEQPIESINELISVINQTQPSAKLLLDLLRSMRNLNSAQKRTSKTKNETVINGGIRPTGGLSPSKLLKQLMELLNLLGRINYFGVTWKTREVEEQQPHKAVYYGHYYSADSDKRRALLFTLWYISQSAPGAVVNVLNTLDTQQLNEEQINGVLFDRQFCLVNKNELVDLQRAKQFWNKQIQPEDVQRILPNGAATFTNQLINALKLVKKISNLSSIVAYLPHRSSFSPILFQLISTLSQSDQNKLFAKISPVEKTIEQQMNNAPPRPVAYRIDFFDAVVNHVAQFNQMLDQRKALFSDQISIRNANKLASRNGVFALFLWLNRLLSIESIDWRDYSNELICFLNVGCVDKFAAAEQIVWMLRELNEWLPIILRQAYTNKITEFLADMRLHTRGTLLNIYRTMREELCDLTLCYSPGNSVEGKTNLVGPLALAKLLYRIGIVETEDIVKFVKMANMDGSPLIWEHFLSVLEHKNELIRRGTEFADLSKALKLYKRLLLGDIAAFEHFEQVGECVHRRRQRLSMLDILLRMKEETEIAILFELLSAFPTLNADAVLRILSDQSLMRWTNGDGKRLASLFDAFTEVPRKNNLETEQKEKQKITKIRIAENKIEGQTHLLASLKNVVSSEECPHIKHKTEKLKAIERCKIVRKSIFTDQ